jgi:hypothetical protein
LKTVEKWGRGVVRESNARDCLKTKVKCAQSGDTLRNPLNINLDINNKQKAVL